MSSWTLAPVARLVRRVVSRGASENVFARASRSWVVAPGEATRTKPAFALEGQLDRVTGWVFGDERDQRMSVAGRDVVHAPTRAFRFDDAVLVDGTVYVGSVGHWLLPRAARVPSLRVDREIDRAAMYATSNGNRWFGMWLVDDCTTYPLAAAEGTPVTTDHAISAPMRDYEARLGMRPTRVSAARLRDLVLFDDVGHNASKRARYARNRATLRASAPPIPSPGVFLLRGLAGDRRVLSNELELAEHLRVARGFTVIDPLEAPLDALLAACAGASTIVGVEGSGLANGLAVLPPGGALVVLQPPSRFCALYKDMTDRDDQRFAYVVGVPDPEGFSIRPDELERTLDLLPTADVPIS